MPSTEKDSTPEYLIGAATLDEPGEWLYLVVPIPSLSHTEKQKKAMIPVWLSANDNDVTHNPISPFPSDKAFRSAVDYFKSCLLTTGHMRLRGPLGMAVAYTNELPTPEYYAHALHFAQLMRRASGKPQLSGKDAEVFIGIEDGKIGSQYMDTALSTLRTVEDGGPALIAKSYVDEKDQQDVFREIYLWNPLQSPKWRRSMMTDKTARSRGDIEWIDQSALSDQQLVEAFEEDAFFNFGSTVDAERGMCQLNVTIAGAQDTSLEGFWEQAKRVLDKL